MHPPKTFAQITKYLLVSIAFPGPTAEVHQPSLLVIGLIFVTNWSPVKAWKASMALVLFLFNFP